MLVALLLSILTFKWSDAAAAGGGGGTTPGRITIPAAFNNAPETNKPAAPKPIDGDCAGLGCRKWYAVKLKTPGRSTRITTWDEKFSECKAYGDKSLPNLDEKAWEAVIDKHMPGCLDIAAKRTKEPTADESAVSLGTLKLIRAIIRDMIKPTADGGALTSGTTYKNPISFQMFGAGAMNDAANINMHDINQFFVKTLTRGLGISFAHLLAEQKVDADGTYKGTGGSHNAVGKITHFVSHDWASPFENFVATAEAHCTQLGCDAATTYYWVCTFANNQHGFEVPQGPVEDVSPFGVALKDAGLQSVLAIQHDGSTKSQVSVGRIWCVFEMALVLKMGHKLYWGCGTTITDFKAGASCGCGSSKALLENFTPATAGVTKQTDKDDIILPWIDQYLDCSKYTVKEKNKPQDCLAEIFQSFAKDKVPEGVGIPRVEVKTAESSPILSSIYLHATFTALSLFVVLRYVCTASKESTVDIYYEILEAEI